MKALTTTDRAVSLGSLGVSRPQCQPSHQSPLGLMMLMDPVLCLRILVGARWRIWSAKKMPTGVCCLLQRFRFRPSQTQWKEACSPRHKGFSPRCIEKELCHHVPDAGSSWSQVHQTPHCSPSRAHHRHWSATDSQYWQMKIHRQERVKRNSQWQRGQV